MSDSVDRSAPPIQDNVNAAKAARTYLASAVAFHNDPHARTARALTSIAASLVHMHEEGDTVGEVDASTDVLTALRGVFSSAASDQPDHYIRWAIAYVRGLEFPAITPEEPEPGRDWSRVEAHIFKPTGKWKYRIYLDYTEMRHGWRASGEGPSGWHFDGAAMAREALQLATERGTSEVTFGEIPADWHMFVQNPPQGYPIWVHGRDWEFEPRVGWHPPTYVGRDCGGAADE